MDNRNPDISHIHLAPIPISLRRRGETRRNRVAFSGGAQWRDQVHDGAVTDAPAYRIWPPIALGVPLLAGLMMTVVAGDPFPLPRDGARVVGAVLLAVFALCVYIVHGIVVFGEEERAPGAPGA